MSDTWLKPRLTQQRGHLGHFFSFKHTLNPLVSTGSAQSHLSLQGLNGALVSGLVCRSAAQSSWVFVSLWVSVSEWDGWWMTLCPSPSRSPITGNVHSLLQVSRKDISSAEIRRALWGLLYSWGTANRDIVLSWAKALRLCELCTKATVGRCLHVYRAEKVQQGIIATWLLSGNRDVCKEQNSNCLPKELSLLSWFHLNVHFCGLQDF